MIKKLISLFAAASMIASFAVAPIFAAADAYVLRYNPNLEASDAGYLNIADQTILVQQGVTKSNSWTGAAGETIKLASSVSGKKELTDKALVISPNETQQNNITGDIKTLDIDFSKRLGNTLLNSENGYILDMYFAATVCYSNAAGGSSASSYKRFELNGKTADGADTIAKMIITAPSSSNTTALRTGTIKMDAESSKSLTFDVSRGQNAAPVALHHLRMIVDMQSNTYSAWVAKIQDATKTYDDVFTNENMLVENAEFPQNIESISGLTLYHKNIQNSKVTYIKDLSVKEIDNRTIVDEAANSISIPALIEEDITLPTSMLGAAVSWSSSNPDAISANGKVTQGADNQKVTLTATVTKGAESSTRSFNVTVKKIFVQMPVPEDGVWVNDDMTYASTDDIPLYINGADFGFDFGTTAYPADTAASGQNTYAVDGESIVLTKNKAAGTGNEADVYKYVALDKQQMLQGEQVIEFRFTPVNNPDIYITISDTTWKGPQTINYDGSTGELEWGSRGTIFKTGSTTAPVKVTLALNHTTRKISAWINDKKWDQDLAYRTDGYYVGGFPDVLKLLVELKAANAPGAQVKLDYVRVLESKEYYSKFCFDNEPTISLPSEIEASVNTISLPSTGKYNNSVAWTSDNDAIKADGTVTHGTSDVVVTLTPTYTNNITGEEKAGAGINVTVKAKEKTTVTGEALAAINPDNTESGQFAVGFANEFNPNNDGYAPELGFVLSYPEKTDKTVTIPVQIEGVVTVKLGLIVTYDADDNFDINKLTVKPYITE